MWNIFIHLHNFLQCMWVEYLILYIRLKMTKVVSWLCKRIQVIFPRLDHGLSQECANKLMQNMWTWGSKSWWNKIKKKARVANNYTELIKLLFAVDISQDISQVLCSFCYFKVMDCKRVSGKTVISLERYEREKHLFVTWTEHTENCSVCKAYNEPDSLKRLHYI